MRDLWKDVIYLLESGKIKLAENFISFLNNCHWLSSRLFFRIPHTRKYSTYTLSIIKHKELRINLEKKHSKYKFVLKNLRLKNKNKIIIGHININSLRNKFESLTEMFPDKVDLLMIFETKLNSSFPNAQFLKPY